MQGPSGLLDLCEELNGADQLIQNFDGNDYLAGFAPGLYTFTYEVRIDGLPEYKAQFPVNFELVDACNPP